jgi:hypothetical protein
LNEHIGVPFTEAGGRMTQLFSNQIFSEVWMTALKHEWNSTPHVHLPLQKAAFTARIGYGFKGESRARGMLTIVNGIALAASEADDEDLDWDLRASRENWMTWITGGFGMAKLGPAISTNSLEFAKGNYRQMIRNLSLSQAFMQHFQLMKKINIGGNFEPASARISWVEKLHSYL